MQGRDCSSRLGCDSRALQAVFWRCLQLRDAVCQQQGSAAAGGSPGYQEQCRSITGVPEGSHEGVPCEHQAGQSPHVGSGELSPCWRCSLCISLAARLKSYPSHSGFNLAGQFPAPWPLQDGAFAAASSIGSSAGTGAGLGPSKHHAWEWGG